MYGMVRESRCANCEHRKVCSFKEQFLNAQKAVDEVTVHTGDKSIKYLRNFDWIKRVELTYWAAFDAIQDEIRRVSTKEEKRRSKGKK